MNGVVVRRTPRHIKAHLAEVLNLASGEELPIHDVQSLRGQPVLYVGISESCSSSNVRSRNGESAQGRNNVRSESQRRSFLLEADKYKHLHLMRRQFSVPASQRTPRNAVDDETAQGISKALKSLRKLSKTVAAFSQALSDELRILERVYYKHLNSQRVTIPWRKVVEVRRILNRLLEADLPKLLDSVRGVFYQSEGATPR